VPEAYWVLAPGGGEACPKTQKDRKEMEQSFQKKKALFAFFASSAIHVPW
jgi:hypothetical protein